MPNLIQQKLWPDIELQRTEKNNTLKEQKKDKAVCIKKRGKKMQKELNEKFKRLKLYEEKN